MKALIFIALLTISSAFAATADYSCQVRGYRIDFFMTRDSSTTVWLTNTDHHHTITQGYVKVIEVKGTKSIYHFYGSNGKLDLTFNTEDTVNLPAVMPAHIDTTADGFLLIERLQCYKQN
jgi:hypothetical protein